MLSPSMCDRAAGRVHDLAEWLANHQDALQTASTEGAFEGLVQSSLMPLLEFGALVAVLGRVSGGQVRALTGHCVGVSPSLLRETLQHPTPLENRPLLARWAANAQPLCFDPDHPRGQASETELGEVAEFSLGRMVIHGVLGASGAEGSYFSFCRVRAASMPDFVKCVQLLVPHLHVALLSQWRLRCGVLASAVTTRERQLLAHLAHGKSNAEIARDTHRSAATVRNQLHALAVKLNARSRMQLVDRSRDLGLLAFGLSE